jgi:hypothetical protein
MVEAVINLAACGVAKQWYSSLIVLLNCSRFLYRCKQILKRPYLLHKFLMTRKKLIRRAWQIVSRVPWIFWCTWSCLIRNSLRSFRIQVKEKVCPTSNDSDVEHKMGKHHHG